MKLDLKLADYEVSGVAMIRAAIPGVAGLSDAAIAGMYSFWSEEAHFAGWLSMDGHGVPPDFIDWVTPTTDEVTR